MTRKKLRRVIRDSDPRPPAPDTPGATGEGTDGFALSFTGGRGVLRLVEQRVSPLVVVDLLEIAIPRISFPFDVSSGIRGLRNRRLQLARLVLTLSLENLEEALRVRPSPASWITNPRVTFEKEYVSILVDYGPAGERFPFSFRLLPATGERLPSLLIDEARAYGPLPAPLLLAAGTAVGELIGTRLDGLELTPPDPVKAAMLKLLPPRGWRLPDHTAAKLIRLELLADRAQLEYRSPDFIEQEIAAPAGPSGIGLLRLRKLEENRLAQAGDRLLTERNEADARATYSRILEQDPENPLIATRLAMIDVLDPDLRDTARALVSGVLERTPDRADALAVLAHQAALSGDAAPEAAAHERLVEGASPLERLAGGLRIGALLHRDDPERAATWLDKALAARREDPHTIMALMRVRAALGQRDRVDHLISRWIAVHKTPGARATAHLAVGELLLRELEDGAGAIRHFERAALADPENTDAAWGLADALAASGDAERAVPHFERLERRCRERGDQQGAARADESIGAFWLAQGEPALAAPRFREALTLAPRSPSRVHAQLAAALLALGRPADAAGELESALRRSSPRDQLFDWFGAALELSRIYLRELDDPDAADPWIRAASGDADREPASRELMLELLERQGNWNALTAELEQALVANPTADSVLALTRARLQTGDFETALSTLQTARRRFPDRLDLLDALIEASRGAGERTALRDALVARAASVEEPAGRAAMHAEIGDLELTAFENPGSAVGWFRKALDQDAGRLAAREGLAQALRRLGRGDDLRAELEPLARALRAAGRRDEASRVLVELARLLLGVDETDRAAALLREALPALPPTDRPDALLEMAQIFVNARNPEAARDLYAAARKMPGAEGEYEAALGEAEAALQLGDHDAALQAAMAAGSGPVRLRARAAMAAAKALLFLGRADEAARTLERVAENVDPPEVAALLMLAARVRQNESQDPEQARHLLEQLLQLEPENQPARQALIELLESSGDRRELAEGLLRLAGDNEEGLADLKRAADFFSAEGAHDRAIVALRRANDIRSDVETSRMLAQSLKRSGAVDEMLALLAELAPHDPAARQLLIAEFEELGRFDELAELIEAHPLSDPPAEVERLLGLARIHVAGRRDDRAALLTLRQALELAPDDPRVHAQLSELLRRLERWEELAALLRSRIERSNDAGATVALRSELAELAAGPLGDRRAAVKSLLAALDGERDPRRARTLADRAIELASAQGEVALLAQCLEHRARVAAADEASGWWTRLAATNLDAGETARARAAAERAVEADPTNGEALSIGARLAADAEDWPRVVALLEQIPAGARKLSQDRQLALALEHGDRADEAIAVWRRVIAREPGDAQSHDQLARLLAASRRHGELIEALGSRIELARTPAEQARLLARRARARAESTGDPAAGIDDLIAAARLAPDDRELVAGAAQGAAKAERWALVDEMLGLLIPIANGKERANLLRRRAAIRRSRLDQSGDAAADLLEALETGELPLAETETLIDLLEAQQDFGNAAEVAARLAEEADEDGQRAARAARLAEAAGADARARDLWRRAIGRHPDPSWCVALIKLLDRGADAAEIGELLARIEGHEDLLDIPDHLAVLDARVELDLARGRDLEAMEGLAAIMDLAPERHDPWRKMVGILERRGEWQQLVQRMEQRIRIARTPEEVARTAVTLGRVLEEKLGDESGAVAAFNRAIEAVPDHQGANLALAALAFRRHQWPELGRRLERIDPAHTNPEIELWRARVAEHHGRREEAIERYRALVSTQPTMTVAVEGLLRVADDPSYDEEIIGVGTRLIEAIGVDAVKAAIHRRVGLAYLNLGRIDEARARLEFADRVSEGDPQSLEALAAIHRAVGAHQQEAEVLSRLAFAVEGAPRARHLARAARIYLDLLGDERRAASWFERAAEILPDDPHVLLGLADCAWITGDLGAVARKLERVRVIAPDLELGASRQYRLARALYHTRAWPDADILELVQVALRTLEGEERDAARALAATLTQGRGGA